MKFGSFDLRKLKQRDIALLFIVLTIIAAVLWYFYMYQPTQESITNLQADITRLETEIVRGEQARDNLPDLRLAVAELEQDRRDFLAQLPKESDIAGLIDQLRASASDSGVIVNDLSRGSAQEEIASVRPIGFSVTTGGSFGDTMAFLGRLEALQRFTKIQQVGLNVQDNASTDPDLQANFGFTVYVFTGEDPGEQ